MPISSSAATLEKKKQFKLHCHAKSIDQNDRQSGKNLLKIASALPAKDKRCLFIRSHSTLNASAITKVQHNVPAFSDSVTVRTHSDGSLHVSRLQEEKETQPDRISLDRKGLVAVPVIDGEHKLRLLSLQHNLVSNLESLGKQSFPTLVFLDLYDNQLEKIHCLGKLENLRVLLLGKNRIKQIEGLKTLPKLEVLDLHGNQISQVDGLNSSTELKVLNLAGNQLKVVNNQDFQGLHSLQELNLRRNKLKKLLGFAEVPNLVKLFVSNNDIHW
ncbi:unnamed protein product [Phaedon cochleariae]|uniref:Dynein axonemal assembly factor 1 homolog n=1 Tax=Phaedon cochleariae TaxID=80249 RepID=A0A9N9X3F9_PHACE|nr:unnamed protein product [Phaedon cochleariae]